jgi:hypothetical protein
MKATRAYVADAITRVQISLGRDARRKNHRKECRHCVSRVGTQRSVKGLRRRSVCCLS